MADSNYNKWTVDSNSHKAHHESGLYIEFSGSPSSNNFSGTPKNIPSSLAAFDQVRLIRLGFEAYRAAFEEAASFKDPLFEVKATEGTPASKTKITIKKRRRVVLDPQA